ncbi:hypothetical protein MTR_6g037390 [Medicago truncatula]|uniref:Uncharacterized protein n=1 Tax=Medicago truncatula TaxID=3880 RepID=A0A072UJC5_MEDTR|nr:hypothetical protein MTR_6g037390 [Medicago truncatula]
MGDQPGSFPISVRVRTKYTEKTRVGLWGQSAILKAVWGVTVTLTTGPTTIHHNLRTPSSHTMQPQLTFFSPSPPHMFYLPPPPPPSPSPLFFDHLSSPLPHFLPYRPPHTPPSPQEKLIDQN